MQKFNRRRFFLLGLGASPLLVAGDACCLELEWVRVRRIRLSAGQPTHRFVQFSDVHHKGDRAYLESVVETVNRLAPDFVCFTGDIVENRKYLPEALEIMGGIRAPMYGVPGNHDYWSHANFAVIGKYFTATGGAWLVDERMATPDGKLHLWGVTCRRPPVFALNPEVKNVLLMHYPAWADHTQARGFDLILAGHSHGGQVRLPFYGPLILPFGVERYDLGMFRTQAGPLYVNSGIGWFHVPVRFNCRPEITVFEL